MTEEEGLATLMLMMLYRNEEVYNKRVATKTLKGDPCDLIPEARDAIRRKGYFLASFYRQSEKGRGWIPYTKVVNRGIKQYYLPVGKLLDLNNFISKVLNAYNINVEEFGYNVTVSIDVVKANELPIIISQDGITLKSISVKWTDDLREDFDKVKRFTRKLGFDNISYIKGRSKNMGNSRKAYAIENPKATKSAIIVLDSD